VGGKRMKWMRLASYISISNGLASRKRLAQWELQPGTQSSASYFLSRFTVFARPSFFGCDSSTTI
jgi:hypothetical protein